jgi:hypothetical protein
MPVVSARYEYSLELLESIVHQGSKPGPTTLLVCGDRKDFFSGLIRQTVNQDSSEDSRNIIAAPYTEYEQPDDTRQIQAKHTFLTPTLSLLAASKNIRLAFCPTVPVLRAYLSTCRPSSGSLEDKSELLVLDLLALHHGTSEFTVQGLMRTFATLVSTSHQTGRSLTLVECKEVDDSSNPARGPALWDAQVPLLSGSIKIGQEGARWAGRSLTIRKVAARWFTFENTPRIPRSGLQGGTGQAIEDDEMLV